jgi:hypothetical protein
VVHAGDDSGVIDDPAAHTTYWFAPGTHLLGNSLASAIIAEPGDTFLGGPGAVIDGQDINGMAFASGNGGAPGVTIKYLTIENFMTGEGGDGEAVVNHDLDSNWTIEYDTVQNNPYGVGIEMGNNNKVEYDCLTNNGETGVQSYLHRNITIAHNEIAYNDSQGLYDQIDSQIQCGCAGGVKVLETVGADISGNYVHDNGDVGIWADTNNVAIKINDNYIAWSYGVGVQYEISYNGQITNNILVDNGLAGGPINGTRYGNVTGAIYISQSGSDPRVSETFGTKFAVTGNIFVNNWGGVVLYENSGRYCDSPGTTGTCTLDDPTAWNGTTTDICDSNQLVADNNSPDYWDLCRWKTTNVDVSDNVFSFNPATIDALLPPGTPRCTSKDRCGFQGLFAFNAGGALRIGGCNLASSPPWSCGSSDSVDISYNWGNVFSDNSYYGPWEFWAFTQGDVYPWSRWKGTLSRCTLRQYWCTGGFGQDSGSTYAASGGPYWAKS